MRDRRLLLLGGTHLGAIAIGVVVGWSFGTNARRHVDMISNVGTVGAYALQLDVLRREGSVGAYRDALLATLAFLESIQEDDDPFLTRPIMQGDQVLILARLARVEANLGRREEAKAYTDRAVRTCLDIPWKQCDAQAVLGLSEQMERSADQKREAS